MTRWRVATLGAGYFGRFHHRAWMRMKDAELVAICERDMERARMVSAEVGGVPFSDDLGTMLDTVRPDILDITVPPEGHLPAIEQAAARRIHVICQKPFCGSLARAERAVAVAEAAGIRLIVHENFRHQPWYGQIRTLLAEGALGTVYTAHFRLRPGDGQGPDAYLARQPYFRAMERFMVHETGVHYVDVFRSLFGEVTAVQARLRRLNRAIAGEDSGVVVMEMSSGVLATLDANRLVDHAAGDCRLTLGEMCIEGSLATLMLDGDARLTLRRHGQSQAEAVEYAWRDEDFGGDCVYLTQRAALDALAGRAPFVNEGRDYLVNLRIEEAIYESNHRRRTIGLGEDAGDVRPPQSG